MGSDRLRFHDERLAESEGLRYARVCTAPPLVQAGLPDVSCYTNNLAVALLKSTGLTRGEYFILYRVKTGRMFPKSAVVRFRRLAAVSAEHTLPPCHFQAPNFTTHARC